MYLLLTIKSNKTHGKEGSVLVAQLIQGVVDGQGGDHLPDIREGSEQSNGDQSEGGQVDAECEVRSEELGAAEEHGNPEEQHHLELAAAIVAWGEEREVTNALP